MYLTLPVPFRHLWRKGKITSDSDHVDLFNLLIYRFKEKIDQILFSLYKNHFG